MKHYEKNECSHYIQGCIEPSPLLKEQLHIN